MESHFLSEYTTSSFSQGPPADPVAHGQRYFFGKLVYISSSTLHGMTYFLHAKLNVPLTVLILFSPENHCRQGVTAQQGATLQCLVVLICHPLSAEFFCLLSPGLLEFFPGLSVILGVLTVYSSSHLHFISSDCARGNMTFYQVRY